MIKSYDRESTIMRGSKEAMCLDRCKTIKSIYSDILNERFILKMYPNAIDIRQDTRSCFQFRLNGDDIVAKQDITEKIVYFKVLYNDY